MVDWRLLSARPDDTRDRVALEAWLEEVSAMLSEILAAEIRKITTAAYERFLDTLEPEETLPALAAAVGDLSAFDGVGDEILRAVDDTATPVLTAMNLNGSLSAYVRATVDADATRFASRWASVVNEQAEQYARTATQRFVGVADGIARDIRRRTANAIGKGLTNEELKNEIGAVSRLSEYRADMIARTEVMNAYNAGNWTGAKALGEYGPTEKVWVATLDRRTRRSHVSLHDRYLPIDEPFAVGPKAASMLYPHDPTGPASEVVNCRCYLETLYPGDTRPDGTVVPGADVDGPTPQPPIEVVEKIAPPTPKPKPRGTSKRSVIARGAPPEGQTFASPAEARTYLEGKHPHVHWAPEIDDYDPRSTAMIARWADRMEEIYPDEWSAMRYVGSQAVETWLPGSSLTVPKVRWASNTYAHAYTGYARTRRGIIGINPRYAKNYEQWLESTSRHRSTLWQFSDTPEGVMIHEFGHIVDGLDAGDLNGLASKLQLSSGSSGVLSIGGYVTPDGTGSATGLREWLARRLKTKAPGAGSRYGGKNEFEAFTETFTLRHLLEIDGWDPPSAWLSRLVSDPEELLGYLRASRNLRSIATWMPSSDLSLPLLERTRRKVRMLETIDQYLTDSGIPTDRPMGFKTALREARKNLAALEAEAGIAPAPRVAPRPAPRTTPSRSPRPRPAPSPPPVVEAPPVPTSRLSADEVAAVRKEIGAAQRELRPLIRQLTAIADEMNTEAFWKKPDSWIRIRQGQYDALLEQIREGVDVANRKADDVMTALWRQADDLPEVRGPWEGITLDRPARVLRPAEEVASPKFRRARDRYVVADTPTLEMNRALRGEIPMTPALQTRVREARYLTEGTLAEDVVVNRTMNLPINTALKLEPGAVWDNPGFQSTQTGRPSPYSRRDRDPGRIHVDTTIRVPAGTNAADLGDGEIVLRPGSMRVLSSRWDGNTLRVVMEWIG